MLRLNDDCLDYIFKLLSFEDQLSVKKTCQRLDHIIKSVWQFHSKHVTSKNLNDLGLDDKEFVDFMSAISNVVEKLSFEDMETHRIRLLENLVFPKVFHLKVDNLKSDDIPNKEEINIDDAAEDKNSTNNSDSENEYEDDDDWINNSRCHLDTDNNDEVILLMSNLFPNLQQLQIYAQISGKYIDRFTKLTVLYLSCCEFLQDSNFEAIFTTLHLRRFHLVYNGFTSNLCSCIQEITKCNTLEELEIDDHHLVFILDELLEFPHIRKITCYLEDHDKHLICHIAKCKGNNIEMFQSNDILWSNDDLVDKLSNMKNMKKLVFYDDEFEDKQMLFLALKLKKLQHVCMRKCRMQSNTAVLHFAEHCKDLRILDISENRHMDNKFFAEIVQLLQKQNYRQIPLELRCFNTNIDEDLLELSDYKSAKDLIRLNKTECERDLPKLYRNFQVTFSNNDVMQ